MSILDCLNQTNKLLDSSPPSDEFFDYFWKVRIDHDLRPRFWRNQIIIHLCFLVRTHPSKQILNVPLKLLIFFS